jgi:hypothetical protein
VCTYSRNAFLRQRDGTCCNQRKQDAEDTGDRGFHGVMISNSVNYLRYLLSKYVAHSDFVGRLGLALLFFLLVLVRKIQIQEITAF